MANCCVIGLGYIGLPTAAILADSGHKVNGFDTNQNIVDLLNSGEIHISEPKLRDLVRKCKVNGSFTASTKPKQSEIYIIAVPTPLKNNEKDLIPYPNIDYVISAIKSIIPILKPKDLIIIESTCPVETTANVFKIIQKSIKFKSEEIFLAYCPERVIPGNILHELLNNDRVVGGINERSAVAAKSFYSSFCNGEINITNSETAEMVKLTENSFRDVNIAFANELSMICDSLKVDVKELINLANHHPRVNILDPGCGVGGHCIAVDPWFIVSKFPEITTIIKGARDVNLQKTKWVLDKILIKSKNEEKLLKRKPIIGILGITYKPNVDDLRESSALNIVMELLNAGEELIISDPYVNDNKTLKISSIEEVINCSDFIVSLVSHDKFQSLSIPIEKILDFTGKY